MGRGRAKAKHTRVARKLKYQSPVVDLDRLRADLRTEQPERDDEPDADGQDQDPDQRPTLSSKLN